MKILRNILIKLIGEDIYAFESFDKVKMQDWLYDSFKEKGYKQYFTLRKKAILNAMSVPLDEKERDMLTGRIAELRELHININKEAARRKNKEIIK
jgi:hypothetical protein